MSPTGFATGAEAASSSHIEEMTKELIQLGGLEVPATRILREGVTTVTGEPSSQSGLPKNLLSLDPQLGKRIKILYILPFLSLLLTLII